jgi:hypothetical protein
VYHDTGGTAKPAGQVRFSSSAAVYHDTGGTAKPAGQVRFSSSAAVYHDTGGTAKKMTPKKIFNTLATK